MESTDQQERIIFWGTPAFAVPSLKALHEVTAIVAVVTQPDRPQGRGQKAQIDSPVKKVAREYGLPVVQPEHVDAALVADLQKFLPATFVVVAFGAIIPWDILKISKKFTVNIHPSLLPDLRGPSPIQTALLRGYTMTGLTLMQLDAEMDHGPLLAQKKVTIVPTDTFVSLSEKLSHMAAQFAAKYLPRYLAGELAPTPQDHNRATFCKLIRASEGLLDRARPAVELHNTIRALNPWPGTYIVVNKKRLKILNAVARKTHPSQKFSRSENGRLVIACGSGALEVMTVQPEGKKAMNSLDFLNGYPRILQE